jgi:hypothetical protein
MNKHCFICKNAFNCINYYRLQKQLSEVKKGDSISFKMPEICGFKPIENNGFFCDACWLKYLDNVGDLSYSEMCPQCQEKTLARCVEDE